MFYFDVDLPFLSFQVDASVTMPLTRLVCNTAVADRDLVCRIDSCLCQSGIICPLCQSGRIRRKSTALLLFLLHYQYISFLVVLSSYLL